MSRPTSVAALRISRQVVVGRYQPFFAGNAGVAGHGAGFAVLHCLNGRGAGLSRNLTGMSTLSV